MRGNSVITKTQCEMLVNHLICSDCCYSFIQWCGGEGLTTKVLKLGFAGLIFSLNLIYVTLHLMSAI
jgi:hypothetical protein